MATVKIARGHIVNEVLVTERVQKDWAFVDQKIILPDAYVSVEDVIQLDEQKETVCQGQWGVFYWRDVYYKRIRVVQQDGSLFSPHVLGVSKDKSYVEATVVCEEHGNSEVICETGKAPLKSLSSIH
jgi:hypothetical protein